MSNLNIPIRTAVALACLLAGFAFWPLFILGAVIVCSIVNDVREEPARRAEAVEIEARVNAPVTRAEMHAACESPAETAFLEAMTTAYGLTAGSGALEGGGLRLETQVGIGRLNIHSAWGGSQYRADFVVDRRLVVEIDGAAYHSSDADVARDAKRDADMRREGYKILRIPAKLVFNSPQAAIRMVEQARAALRDGGAERRTAGETALTALQAADGVGRAVVDAARATPAWLAALSDKVDHECERSLIRTIIQHFFVRIEAAMAAAGRHVEKMAEIKRWLGTDLDGAARVALFRESVERSARAFSERNDDDSLDQLRAVIRDTPGTDHSRALFEKEADAVVDAHLAKIATVHDAIFPGRPLFADGTNAGKARIVNQIRAVVFEGTDPGRFTHPYFPPVGSAKIIWAPWTTVVARLR